MVNATYIQYWEVLFITILMFTISYIFSKKFGLSREEMNRNRKQINELREKLMMASGNIEEQYRIQHEAVELMNKILIKQYVPLCIKTVIFLGFFALFGAIYSGVEFFDVDILFLGRGFTALYFTYSITIGLLMFLIKTIYRKIKGEAARPTEEIVPEISEELLEEEGTDSDGSGNIV